MKINFSILASHKLCLLTTLLFFAGCWCYAQKILEGLEQVTMQTHGNKVRSVAWCDGCNYLAIGGDTGSGGSDIRVYSFKKTTSTLEQVTMQTHGNKVYSVAWCDGCNYLAIGGKLGTGGSDIRVYSFKETTSTLEQVTTQTHGNTVYSVAWCDGCKYLAIGGGPVTYGIENGSEIRVYSFKETTSTLEQVTTQTHGNVVSSVAWCDGCKYLAIGGWPGTGDNDISVYSFDTTTSTLTQVTTQTHGSYVWSVAWCDVCETGTECNYLAIGGHAGSDSAPDIRVYSFNTTTSTLEQVTIQKHGWEVYSVAWCDVCETGTECNYLAIGGEPNAWIGIRVYSFNQTTSTLEQVTSQAHKNASFYSVAWCDGCDYLAIGGDGGYPVSEGSEIRIYKSIFKSPTPPPPPPPSIQPPTNLRAVQEYHRFPTQADLINAVAWDPVVNAIEYHVYANVQLTQLLFTVKQTTKPFFCHHCRKPWRPDTYYIVAIDLNGNKSSPAVITIP